MQNRNAFAEIVLRRVATANRIAAVHPPRAPRLSASKRRWSGSTLKTFALPRIAITIVFLALAFPLLAAVREVRSIGLTVDNLGRELNFFTNTLPFELVSISEASGREQDALLGLSGVRLRVSRLKLGDEYITLTEHLSKKGRSIPQDSRSFDHWFQHIAIVVRDMDKAYEQLRQHKVMHVSTAPQTLPAWNKGAAGIKAFYFRDPEDHVLEIIFFPPGKGDPKWQQAGTNIFLGIDHTAIVVSETDKSLAFYRDLLGLRVVGESENFGVEQEHLNQVFGARLRITALRAEQGPGIEFLEYISPPGGRALPENAKADDLIFWHTDFLADEINGLAARLHERGTRFVSAPSVRLRGESADSFEKVMLRDPDGHALQLIRRADPALSSVGPSGNGLSNR